MITINLFFFIAQVKVGMEDLGITWNTVTESGSVVVGDKVKFSVEIQLIRQT